MQATGWSYALRVNYYEIYNETIRDLLMPSNASNTSTACSKGHAIRLDKETNQMYVEGLMDIPIQQDQGFEQIEQIMLMAASNRSTESTGS